MFEQHPVPQQISSYQFRLVGDMTLKQFFQLGGGAVIGLLLYASPLPAIFKWPLIVFFVLMGAAFAFLPLQERPLSEWILAFFRSVYGPTLFIWTKPQTTESYFAPEQGAPVAVVASTPIPNAPVSEPHTSKLEEAEKSMLNRVASLFTLPGKSSSAAQATIVTPQLAPKEPLISTPREPSVMPTRPITVENKQGFIAAKTADAQQSSQNVPIRTTQTFTPTNTPPAIQAQFSPEAAPPNPPSQPNIVVGQVMDLSGKIVNGAIMEIKDQMGRPVRAFRTNQVGHFMIVTPLTDGQYKIFVEKDGLTFDPINLEAKGTLLPPVAIRARNSIAK